MPYNPSTGVYTPVAGSETATAGQTIASATWNNINADYQTAFTQLGQGTIAPPTSTITVVSSIVNSNITLPTTLRARTAGAAAPFSIGGFTGGADGLRLYLFNNLSQTMTIVNEDLSSISGNRITTSTGNNIVFDTGSTAFATFSYDGSASRWILESYNLGAVNQMPPASSLASSYFTAVQTVNFAASASDIATFTIMLPVSVSIYKVNALKIGNAAATLNSATVSLFTGAGATGTVVISSTATTVTASISAASAQVIVPASASTTTYNSPQLFLHVTTSTASSTADVVLQIEPIY
jgi:hypothetical protein